MLDKVARKILHGGQESKGKIMEVSISCDAFARLAKISSSNSEGYLRSIWLEVTEAGDVIAVATNRKIAAIEKVGKSTIGVMKMNVCVDEKLVEQCKTEIAFNSSITFVNNEALKFISAKTSLGFVHSGNAGIYATEENAFETWRDWFPDEIPTEPNGGIFSNLENLALLASSSPTASVVFQEIIDNKKPVIVQDIHEPAWLGLFMPRPDAQTRSPEPFSVPGWVK